ncbi:hypothetical protein [Lysobacter sp. CA199]|uniref:hypothetical protein n=1 Tax=Lysobacter sp. CA199 TaxID=3455608 RepID=UPI003F8D6F87
MKSNQVSIKTFGATGLLLLSAAAQAGTVTNPSVIVSDVYATGSLAAARNSPDATQYIECTSEANSVSSQVVAQCMARDSAGARLECSSTDPNIIAVVQSISSSSYLSITTDGRGKCLHVLVANSSRFLP